jgi:PAS domain S-box-containing protein
LDFHSNILSYVTSSIIVTDLSGSVIYWNKGAERIFGYKENEIKGKSVVKLFENGGRQELLRNLNSIESKEEFVGEWKGVTKEGKSVWVSIRTSKFYDPDGTFIGYIGIAHDITAQKIAQQNLAFLARASKQFAM